MIDRVTSDFEKQFAGIQARRQSYGYADRRAALANLGAAVRQNKAALVTAMASDFGKPVAEVILTDFILVIQ